MQKQINLLNDEFSADEANELLLNIYKSKIQFYKIKNLSSHVKFGFSDQTAIQRINELNKTVEQLNEIIKNAKQNNEKLIINSSIKINITSDKYSYNEN